MENGAATRDEPAVIAEPPSRSAGELGAAAGRCERVACAVRLPVYSQRARAMMARKGCSLFFTEAVRRLSVDA